MTDSRRFFSMKPVDSWFFRDGRPMHSNESALGSFKSLFPPFASTVTGCLRAAFARSGGWKGRSRWSKQLNDDLGDYNKTGPLRFAGPHLCKEETLYFPVPQNLYFEGRQPRAMASPSEAVHMTDLSPEPIRVPEVHPYASGLKVRDDVYVSRDGLAKMLEGTLPDEGELLPASELWAYESRIGIKRKAETLTTEENALYTTEHVRLRDDVSLVCGVGGLKGAYAAPSRPQPFGGEGRLASIEELVGENIPSHFTAKGAPLAQFALYLLTPLKMGEMSLVPHSAIRVGGITSWLQCAVTSAVLHVGGWTNVKDEDGAVSFRKQMRSPLMLGGAVLYCESETAKLCAGDVVHIGDETEFGFGVAVVGQWNVEGK
ncbi:type III-B CRISPR module-associated protein Cmr3 [Desulfobaculum senezii]